MIGVGSRVAGWLCGLVCAGTLPLLALAPRPSANPLPVVVAQDDRARASGLSDLISRYVDAVDGREGTTGSVGSIGGLDDLRKALDRVSPAVLPALPPERRRRVLAAFALEAAGAGAAHEPAGAGRLIEWACQTVREHRPADAFDARWQLASVALLEALDNPSALDAHLSHAEAQFPAEPRFILARGLAQEQRTEPGEVGSAPVQGRAAAERQQRAEDALHRFQGAVSDVRVADPTDRAEAWLHAGHLELGLRQPESALAAFTETERLTQDPSLVYLARLFRGRALESEDKFAEAATAYTSALRLIPGAPSATIALAGVRFRHGARRDGRLLIDTLVREGAPIMDPWWSYWTGDSRLWQARIGGLRGLLK